MKYYNPFMKRLIYPLIALIFITSCSKEKKSEKAAVKMQQFIKDIAAYARSYNPNFIIIPQNGEELIYNETDKSAGIYEDYVNTINGIGSEDIFYLGTQSIDPWRLDILREAKSKLKIMVSDYIALAADVPTFVQKANEEGFICFPRTSGNQGYTNLPDSAINDNTLPVSFLSQAQNYLYLINPESYASKEQFLTETDATNYDVMIIDLFFADSILNTTDLNRLKTKPNGNRRLVLSYINIGAAENWRYYWQDDWKLHHPCWLKKNYKGYEDEIWVKFWKKEWQDIIFGNNDSYIKKIIDADFDGAYLDNVEAYYFLHFE
ncbi:MAG: hypothetical protein BWY70_00312 [Bacteroidetes bacterium ADurb.Bin408]|nr:MAG: hypothetical protein BWY70_00312 [Bacteroidetes bacterium ADurb.Bin408]